MAECIHGIEETTCSICLHGLPPKEKPGIAHCRSCDAPIIWVVTEKDKKMPIDAEPSPEGTFIKFRLDANGDKIVHFVKESERAATTKPLYASHFATCPDAAEHRK